MSGIIRDSAKLLTSGIIAQAIGMAVYPILTRLYSPDNFGLLNLFTSIAGVVVLIGSAEYQYAIVLPKDDNKARAVAHISLMILAVVSMTVCLSLPFAKPIAALFNTPALAQWWWLMPLYVLTIGTWNILNYIYIRKSHFTDISGYQISQSVVNAGFKVGFGYLGLLNGGLLISTILGPLIALASTVTLSWRKCLSSFAVKCTKTEYLAAAREYANFPKFNLPRALVNTIGLSIPVWLLTPSFGLDETGRLSLALLAAFFPLNLIARACYQVLFLQVTDLVQRHQSISLLMSRFCLYTTGFTAVGLTAVYFFVPQLVALLFGSQWTETAAIIRSLYPALVWLPICGSICFLTDIFAKQKTAMLIEIGYVLVMTVAIIFGIHTGNFLTTVKIYAWVSFAYLSLQLIWFLSLIRHYQQTL